MLSQYEFSLLCFTIYPSRVPPPPPPPACGPITIVPCKNRGLKSEEKKHLDRQQQTDTSKTNGHPIHVIVWTDYWYHYSSCLIT